MQSRGCDADPCDGFQCPATFTCQIDDRRRPVCRCADHCDNMVDRVQTAVSTWPVCGSDGLTYRDECKLRVHACKVRRDITVSYVGYCSPGNSVVSVLLSCDVINSKQCNVNMYTTRALHWRSFIARCYLFIALLRHGLVMEAR